MHESLGNQSLRIFFFFLVTQKGKRKKKKKEGVGGRVNDVHITEEDGQRWQGIRYDVYDPLD